MKRVQSIDIGNDRAWLLGQRSIYFNNSLFETEESLAFSWTLTFHIIKDAWFSNNASVCWISWRNVVFEVQTRKLIG